VLAGIAVGDEKPSREPRIGHEPIRVAEADVRGTCPDWRWSRTIFLIVCRPSLFSSENPACLGSFFADLAEVSSLAAAHGLACVSSCSGGYGVA
jgi:hypothetical protein